ncbi:MAG: apolipoprotein N-acyltransferase, partial [Pseudomonadota bacterium]
SLLAYGDSLLWLMPFGLILLPAFFALYFALFGYMIEKTQVTNILTISLTWLLMEFVRSYLYIEFPWILIGYIWSDDIIISQSVSLFGIFGLSFLTIFWTYAITESFLKTRTQNFNIILVAFISFIACYVYGAIHLSSPLKEQNIKVRIIQPNLDQNLHSRLKNNFNNLMEIIDLSQNSDDIDYVIWPEGANEYTMDGNLIEYIKSAAPKNGSLILNASRKGDDKYYNSLFIVNNSGEILDIYDKMHLVPLGEFIPFKLRSLLPFINKITPGENDYSPGSNIDISKTKYPFLPSICYEDSFPEHPNYKFTWIVNLTNDGWFGPDIGPHQHLEIAKFRSIEHGVPMVRASLTGISAIIDSFGNISHKIPLFEKGIINTKVPEYLANSTLYHKYGNHMLILLILIFGLPLCLGLFNNFYLSSNNLTIS